MILKVHSGVGCRVSCVLSLGISCHFGPIRKLDENRDKYSYIAEALQAASGVLVVILIHYFRGSLTGNQAHSCLFRCRQTSPTTGG